MENTLHRQLKALYAPDAGGQEVRVGAYRIDALQDGRLVEIQCASLGAIRGKVRDLVDRHDVLVVKPLAVRKLLITRRGRRKDDISSRYSPLRQTVFHAFEDLVHFVSVFPHPRLTVELVLAEWEEHRVGIEAPPRRRRRYARDYRVTDRVLREVHSRVTLQTPADLFALLPAALPEVFGTDDLARSADIPRWLAQKAAYCLRKIGVIAVIGKRGNTWLYRALPPRRTPTKARRAA